MKNDFTYKDLKELADVCIRFYNTSLRKEDYSKKRRMLAGWVEKFHRESRTLTPKVKEAIEKLEDGHAVLLMTAHQPNLFAYSGVIRKATLNQALSEKIKEKLNLPVISLFGIADQDFTDDRWVKSTLIPDVERRNGTLELRVKLPEKTMLNKTPKPTRETLERWRKTLEAWIRQKTQSIKKLCKELKIEGEIQWRPLNDNLETFWRTVEEAYKRAENYADFNAYILSKIVNESWEYDTLFCRFSECQRIFKEEFEFLLKNFETYSKKVREAIIMKKEAEGGGVYEREYQTIPFWYHCDCGSKARLLAERRRDALTGHGRCVKCEKEYRIDLMSGNETKISEIIDKVSARSITMPMIFFKGLGVSCYVGGVGGIIYLKQAKYVAEKMGISFPPVVVWRPHDIYLGIAQLEAILTYKKLTGTYNLTKSSEAKTELARRITNIKDEIEKLEMQKEKVKNDIKTSKEKKIKKIKELTDKQREIRWRRKLPTLARNMILLENVEKVMNLHPSIIDYAVNIGLKDLNKQWMRHLNRVEGLTKNLNLVTFLDKSFPSIKGRVIAR